MSEESVKVLDHGYVKVVGSMGTDETIVEAARMSTGRGFVSWYPYKRCRTCDRPWLIDQDGDTLTPVGDEKVEDCCVSAIKCREMIDFPRGDMGVLDTLYSNHHMTPFEMCELVIEVQAPIMVFREWHRHRTQSYNEFSARYSQMPNVHYIPELERIQKQSSTNKQGSGEPLHPQQAENARDLIRHEQNVVYADYADLLKQGIAKEIARINTPVSRYSKMRAKGNLRNWLGFLMLRCDKTAQWEIRQYADVVAGIVKEIWPKTYNLFLEYDFFSAKFSRTEMAILVEYFQSDDAVRRMGGLAEKHGMGMKKFAAFCEKFTTLREEAYPHLR